MAEQKKPTDDPTGKLRDAEIKRVLLPLHPTLSDPFHSLPSGPSGREEMAELRNTWKAEDRIRNHAIKPWDSGKGWSLNTEERGGRHEQNRPAWIGPLRSDNDDDIVGMQRSAHRAELENGKPAPIRRPSYYPAKERNPFRSYPSERRISNLDERPEDLRKTLQRLEAWTVVYDNPNAGSGSYSNSDSSSSWKSNLEHADNNDKNMVKQTKEASPPPLKPVMAQVTQQLVSQEDIERLVQKLNSRKRVTEKIMDFSPEEWAIMTALVHDKAAKEEDERFEWLLDQLDISKIRQRSHATISSRAKSSVLLCLKRSPRPEADLAEILRDDLNKTLKKSKPAWKSEDIPPPVPKRPTKQQPKRLEQKGNTEKLGTLFDSTEDESNQMALLSGNRKAADTTPLRMKPEPAYVEDEVPDVEQPPRKPPLQSAVEDKGFDDSDIVYISAVDDASTAVTKPPLTKPAKADTHIDKAEPILSPIADFRKPENNAMSIYLYKTNEIEGPSDSTSTTKKKKKAVVVVPEEAAEPAVKVTADADPSPKVTIPLTEMASYASGRDPRPYFSSNLKQRTGVRTRAQRDIELGNILPLAICEGPAQQFSGTTENPPGIISIPSQDPQHGLGDDNRGPPRDTGKDNDHSHRRRKQVGYGLSLSYAFAGIGFIAASIQAIAVYKRHKAAQDLGYLPPTTDDTDFFEILSSACWLAVGLLFSFQLTIKHGSERNDYARWMWVWCFTALSLASCFVSVSLYLVSTALSQGISGAGSALQMLVYFLTIRILEKGEFETGRNEWTQMDGELWIHEVWCKRRREELMGEIVELVQQRDRVLAAKESEDERCQDERSRYRDSALGSSISGDPKSNEEEDVTVAAAGNGYLRPEGLN